MVRSASLQTCFLLTKKDARNLGFDRDIIQNNPEREWKCNAISYNPNINMDIIRNNLEKPWSWYGISRNPNITW